MAHTPKNILIRALLKPYAHFNKASYTAYQEAAKSLHLNLSLEKQLKAINKL